MSTTTSARAAPYPATTAAKGWRFELAYEQIERSDTWGLANELPMAKPCLLMMWFVAWTEKPCGSLPSDENVIRAKCGIPPATWEKLRGVLMRGWWLADDGRLYHDTLVARVLEMMSKRRSDSDRQAAKRAREAAESNVTSSGLTDVSRVTPPEVQPESSTDNRPQKKEISKPSASHPAAAAPGGAFERFWSTWPRHKRKAARKQCAAKWRSMGCDEIADTVIAALEAAKLSDDWRKQSGEFIPAPLVWLNQARWEAPAPEAASITVPATETVAEYHARVERERAASMAGVTKPPAAVLAMVRKAVQTQEPACP